MKKKAKLIFKHNSFEIIEEGEYVLYYHSWERNSINQLTYWNVDLQEAYFSPKKQMKDLKI